MSFTASQPVGGREYYTDIKVVPATAQNVDYELSNACKAVLVVGDQRGFTVTFPSGESVLLGRVVSGNSAIFPVPRGSSIKSTVSSGIGANKAYELF